MNIYADLQLARDMRKVIKPSSDYLVSWILSLKFCLGHGSLLLKAEWQPQSSQAADLVTCYQVHYFY